MVNNAVTIEIIVAGTREIESEILMLEGLPVFPAHEIIVAEVLVEELDAALAADLKDNSGIGPGHVRIACLLGEKIRIRICISLLKIDVRHADTGAKKTDRLI